MVKLSLWIAIACGIVPQTLPAQSRVLDAIQVTATRRLESNFDVPASLTILTNRMIRQGTPQTIMDLLHGMPGTFVQQTTPGQGVVIVRGLKGSEVLHVVDGFRLNNALFRNAPNQYIALVDSQAVEQIEVLRGPSSTLYGSDAMGGVVHMLTAEPRFQGSQWQARSQWRGIYSTADHGFLTRLSGATGKDGISVSGGVTGQDVDELRVGGGDRLPFTDFTSRAADGKLLWQPDADHELMLQVQLSEQPKTPRFDELVPGFGQTRPNSSTFYFEPQMRAFGQARYRYHGETPWFDRMQVNLGQQLIIDDRRTRGFDSNNEDTEENSSRLSGLSMQFGKTLNDSHALSYGLELYQDEILSSRFRTNLASGTHSTLTPRFPNSSSMQSLGAYIADDWLITPKLDLNTGLRYSSFRIVLPNADAGQDVKLEPDHFTGHAGLRYALTERTNLVTNFGRGFRAPNVFDLGTFGSRPGNRFNIPNIELGPETVNSIDVGFKHASNRAEAEFIVFGAKYKDKITAVLTGERTESGALITQSSNATRLELWGVETGAHWFASEVLELYGSATYTHGKEEFEGEQYPADRIPPLFGKLGLVWRHNAWEIDNYGFFATRQDKLSPRDYDDPRINPAGTGGWGTFNLRVQRAIDGGPTLAIRAENLADKRYREHGSGLDDPGRNLVFSIDWEF